MHTRLQNDWMICTIPPRNKIFFSFRNFRCFLGGKGTIWLFEGVGDEWPGSALGMTMLDSSPECCFIQKCLPFILACSVSRKAFICDVCFLWTPPPPNTPYLRHYMYKPLQEIMRYIKFSLKVSHITVLCPPFNCVWSL